MKSTIRKRVYVMLSAIILLSMVLAPAGAQSAARIPDSDLVPLVDEATANFHKATMIIAFGTFTYGDTGLSSPYSIVLQEELGSAILHSKSAKLLSRNVAAAMDPALRSQYDDLVKNDQMDTLLYGRFVEEGDMVRIHLEMTDMSTKLTAMTQDIRRHRRTVPAGVSLRPEASVATKAEELTHVFAAKPGASVSEALRISVSTDKGNGGAYVDGEKLQILLTATKDAYVKIYHIDVYGQAKLIYPNQFDPGRKIRAGSILRIPGSAGFELRLEPPHGTEFIKAVASTTPFLFTEADFAFLGSDAKKVISSGAQTSTSAQESETAEAMASYYIGARLK